MIPVWFLPTAIVACAIPLLALAAYWTYRVVADVLDERRETPMLRLDDDTDVLDRIRCTDLVPVAVVDAARAPFREPAPTWWLDGWTPPAAILRPAVIGDAMTVLHSTDRQSPAWTVSREVTS